jgi:hypothetical protein
MPWSSRTRRLTVRCSAPSITNLAGNCKNEEDRVCTMVLAPAPPPPAPATVEQVAAKATCDEMLAIIPAIHAEGRDLIRAATGACWSTRSATRATAVPQG